MEGTAMRLKRSYRYSLEELPFSRAKGMRYSSPSSTITSCLCLPTGPLECIKPCQTKENAQIQNNVHSVVLLISSCHNSIFCYALHTNIQAMTHKGTTHPLHRRDEQVIKCSKWRLSQVAGAAGQGRVTVFGRWHGVTEQAGHTLAAPAQTQQKIMPFSFFTSHMYFPSLYKETCFLTVHMTINTLNLEKNICMDSSAFVFFSWSYKMTFLPPDLQTFKIWWSAMFYECPWVNTTISSNLIIFYLTTGYIYLK